MKGHSTEGSWLTNSQGWKEEVGLLEGKEQASRLNSYIPRDKLKV
jgi:hypothetical protein